MAAGSKTQNTNRTMMQFFEWYLPNDGLWWKRCSAKADNLAELGITDVWLPPAYKGFRQDDVGYGVYDTYDLGEFDQKGTVRTKYGTRAEYLDAIKSFHKNNIKVFADIVLNHRMGADECEEVMAHKVSPGDRNRIISEPRPIRVWSRFTFPGRGKKYSDFVWDHNCFTGADWDENTKEHGQLYCFEGKSWSLQTDMENGNFDYLMGCDVDMDEPVVLEEIYKWLSWYIDTTGIDGVRLDAVKHIKSGFYSDMLSRIRKDKNIALPAIGEYWSGDAGRLTGYLDSVDNCMSLFDVSLHFRFFDASKSGPSYDLRRIFDGTLLSLRPDRAITFLDNHDTQYGQSLQSYIEDGFRQLAYAIILLRSQGTPCVFYSDYYGNPPMDRLMVPNLGKLIKIRSRYAYGDQIDYFDDPGVLGWVRRGADDFPDSGLAVILSNNGNGKKRMEAGKKFAGELFYDAMGECTEPVTVDDDGWCDFYCNGNSVSVWVRAKAFEYLTVNE